METEWPRWERSGRARNGVAALGTGKRRVVQDTVIPSQSHASDPTPPRSNAPDSTYQFSRIRFTQSPHFELHNFRMNGFNSIVVAIAAALVTCFANEASCRESEIQFNRDVLPILAENCFACHGFDSKSREADLRLDGFDWATEDRGGYRVVAPGDPESSELVVRVAAEDPDLVMPPPDSGKRLTAADRKTLRQWILQGAEYESHWAFIPPQSVPPPDVPSSSHPVDSFIQANLAEAGLAPAPLADPVSYTHLTLPTITE